MIAKDAPKNIMLKNSVLHIDETPVAMLKPGDKQTHKAYVNHVVSRRTCSGSPIGLERPSALRRGLQRNKCR